MCGIVGYIGQRQALPVLLDGLQRLEYRGYDSAGIAVLNSHAVEVRKRKGSLQQLREAIKEEPLPDAVVGIGHTRWATHGQPSDPNAHPHADEAAQVAVVHNGIIENFKSLRRELEGAGHRFRSETDSEIIPHLIESYLKTGVSFVEAVRRAVARLEGAFALAIISKESDEMVAVKQASPLVVGLGEGENFVASDIPALLPYTRRVVILDEGEMAVIRRDGVTFTDLAGNPVHKDVLQVEWEAEMAEKGGYPHFMLKEIHEQPRALRDTMRGRMVPEAGLVNLDEIKLDPAWLRGMRKVYFVACGTAYHAGLVGKTLLERWAGVPGEADVASEFRYRVPLIDEKTLMVVISQSGETADTLAALREAKARGARVVAITNVVGSSVARECDSVLYTWAGPEIAVASTKAYTTQLLAVTLFALYVAQLRGTLGPSEIGGILEEIQELPGRLEEVLGQEERIAELARKIAAWEDTFFIGRGLDFMVALEGQLKLKEISYIHAEAYPAGELKHGTLALIEDQIPVLALATQPSLFEKMASNIQEVKARDAYVIGLTAERKAAELAEYVDEVLVIPDSRAELAPILAAVPLQLLAYYAAVARGANVDKPRNLAKSVTVE